MHRWAEEREGRCLADQYRHSQIKLEWQCREGHRWSATPMSIHQGRWCPVCARIRNRKSDLPWLKDEAVQSIQASWDANVMLAQEGYFFLRDVCEKIPFSCYHITYYLGRYKLHIESSGVMLDAGSGRHVVEMKRFSEWIDRIWNGYRS